MIFFQKPWLFWPIIGLALLTLLGMIFVVQTSPPKKRHTTGQLRGDLLYKAYCLDCHGETGQSVLGSKKINLLSLSAEEFTHRVRRFQGNSHPYYEILTQTECIRIYNYLKLGPFNQP